MNYRFKICKNCRNFHTITTCICQCGNREFIEVSDEQLTQLSYEDCTNLKVTRPTFGKLFEIMESKEIIEDDISKDEI
jgi:hypothetical protein